MTQHSDQLSTLFRTIESEQGSTQLAEFVMDTLQQTLDNFKTKTVDDLFKQFYKLFCEIKNTQPRISLVIFYFFDVWQELEAERSNIQTVEDFKAVVLRATQKVQVENADEFETIVRAGAALVEDGDTILVHSHSGTVRRILATAVHQKKKFTVILAEQETDKTIDMVSDFTANKIPFVVVPEYMLSHIAQDVTKVFFGATTLNYDQNFVCDAGSYSVLAEFHADHIPTYMFMATKKFSLWQSNKAHSTYKTSQKKVHADAKKILTYERIKFSHDRVPAELFDFVVTEMGTMKPTEIKKLYTERYNEREQMRTDFFSDKESEK